VDPVGACVGMKGSRVQNIVQELRGEKIDIVNYDEDVARFVCNALAPAEIAKVFVDEGNREMEVVVPDSQLSLAIGKKGQNVRLAAKLTHWKLDILSETNMSTKNAQAILNLMLIPGMNETMAQNIYQSGFSSVQVLNETPVESIMNIPGYDDPDKAQKLLDDVKALVEQYKAEGKTLPTVSAKGQDIGAPRAAQSSQDAKSAADARLREEMAQLNKKENE
jgi:N utilization substance protein A